MQLSRARTPLALSVAIAFTIAAARSGRSADSEPKRPRFVNVAGKSDFAYRTNNDFHGRKFFPQPMCGGVAAFDFDNDGKLDLFFTNGAKLPELVKTDASFFHCLLRNRGDGTFEDVTAKAGLAGEKLGFSFGVAAGDYDNDGYADLTGLPDRRPSRRPFRPQNENRLHHLVTVGTVIISSRATC